MQHRWKQDGLFFGHVRLQLALQLPQRFGKPGRHLRMLAMHGLNLPRQRYELWQGTSVGLVVAGLNMADQIVVAHCGGRRAGSIEGVQRRQRPPKFLGIHSPPVGGAVEGEFAVATEIDLEPPEDRGSARQGGGYVADGALPKFRAWELGVHHKAPYIVAGPNALRGFVRRKAPSRRAASAPQGQGHASPILKSGSLRWNNETQTAVRCEESVMRERSGFGRHFSFGSKSVVVCGIESSEISRDGRQARDGVVCAAP